MAHSQCLPTESENTHKYQIMAHNFLKKYPHNISPANTLMSKQKVNGGPTCPSHLHSKLAFLIPKNLAEFQKCAVAILQGR